MLNLGSLYRVIDQIPFWTGKPIYKDRNHAGWLQVGDIIFLLACESNYHTFQTCFGTFNTPSTWLNLFHVSEVE